LAADSIGERNTLTQERLQRGSVEDETEASDLLHGKPKGVDVGSLEKGDSLQMIAQMFGRNHSSVQGILAETGGIRPAPRCRSRLALTSAEREEISRHVVAGQSIRCIASRLGRAPSTISR
jgi:DNA-binding NarL/FixJ family response regulator